MIDDVTVVIKTFIRPNHCTRLVRSIRKYYPDIKIVVVNDGNDGKVWKDDNMKTVVLPFNSGISAGRNAGVAAVETEYFVLCDDDFIFVDKTNVERWRDLLIEYNFDILGSRLDDPAFGKKRWTWTWEVKNGKIYEKLGSHSITKNGGFDVAHVDFCLNTFIARTKSVQNCPWDNKYKIMEHRPFFWKHRNDLRVGWCEEIVMGHDTARNNPKYRAFRNNKRTQRKYLAMHKADGYNFAYQAKTHAPYIFKGKKSGHPSVMRLKSRWNKRVGTRWR